jgi:RNA recognition motif-containing protein
MRLAEEDIRAIQVDGPRRRVYIKFTREDRMKDVLQGTNGLLEFRQNNGEISQVRIEHAGMVTRKVRVTGLPPVVKEHSIKEYLSKYGHIVSIRDELLAAAYRYKVYNGIRIDEIKLK